MSEPDAAPVVLEARGLGKSYPHLSGPVPVLTGVDLEVRRGQIVAIVGKSGVGKSTLLHVLGTLDRPTAGEVRLLGRDAFALPDDEISVFRNDHLGFVFQFHHLLPEFTALENVMLPALIRSEGPSAARSRAEALLRRVELDHRLEHKPSELSGGEQQRVALARALVRSPDIVLADEPTGNLDPRTGAGVHELFLDVSRDLGVAVLVATHNRDLARLSDRRLRLQEGRVSED